MMFCNHICIVILVVSTATLGMTACGSTGSNGGSSDSSNGTGAAAGTGASTNGGTATGGNGTGGTAGIGGSAGAGTSGGAGGGAETGTTGGSGGGSGGGGGAPAKPLYVVSIDHWASPSRLLKVDVTTGIGKKVCDLPVDFDTVNYHSITFSRDGILFASNANDARIDRIDPCKCDVAPVGPTGFGSVPGISANHDNGLYGVENTLDVLLDISPANGAGTIIEPLGVDFQNTGATWSDALFDGQGGIYSIHGTENALYTINPWLGPDGPGITSPGIPIVDLTFISVGIEMHPANGVIYACTNDTILYSIDPETGKAKGIGMGMGHTTTCNNLAAPWTPIECLDAF